MQKKRKSPIALSLFKNSKSAMFSAIEIHNKPVIKYRYEIVVLLILNAWELILKAYIYKFIQPKKIFSEDGRTISFLESLEIVKNKFEKQYMPLSENLKKIYDYRNQVSHFYIEELDIIIFSLIKKNLQFYSDFVKLHFFYDLCSESDLILLPIGFKKFYSPVDFISNESHIKSSSNEVKRFVSDILNSTRLLASHGIDESIIVDFKLNLTNVRNIKNSDLIAGIDNTRTNLPIFTVNKENPQKVYLTNAEAKQLTFTHEVQNTQGVLVHEELSERLFDEINNIVNANSLIAKEQNSFVLGELAYYRIYSERSNVVNIDDNFLKLAYGGFDLYAPFLYWVARMKPKAIAIFLKETWSYCKNPNVYNLIVLSTLLGKDVSKYFLDLLKQRFLKIVQKPNYFYTFQNICTSNKRSDIRLMALRASEGKSLVLHSQKEPIIIKYLLANDMETSSILSNECMAFFKGKKALKLTIKTLDILENGQIVYEKADKVYEELIKN